MLTGAIYQEAAAPARASCSRRSLDLSPPVKSNHKAHTAGRPRVSVFLLKHALTGGKQKHVGVVRSAPNPVPCAQRRKNPETAAAARSGPERRCSVSSRPQNDTMWVFKHIKCSLPWKRRLWFIHSSDSGSFAARIGVFVRIHRWMSCGAFMDFPGNLSFLYWSEGGSRKNGKVFKFSHQGRSWGLVLKI